VDLPHTTPHVGLRRLCLLLAAAGLLALFVDVPLSRALVSEDASWHVPGDLMKAINICEFFGHGAGVLLVFVAAFSLDVAGRRRLWRMGACVFAAGWAAAIAKVVLIARIRPQHFDFVGGVRNTFQNLCPLFTSADWQLALANKQLQSFPSGHSATAAGLAVGLSWAYPQGRWFFTLLAALAMTQRIVSGAHYLSDTLWGAAIGGMAAWVVISCPWPGRWFDDIERADASSTTT
jgi:membrane-associated phospholipid phosphatase